MPGGQEVVIAETGFKQLNRRSNFLVGHNPDKRYNAKSWTNHNEEKRGKPTVIQFKADITTPDTARTGFTIWAPMVSTLAHV
jgi:hypothetical protein